LKQLKIHNQYPPIKDGAKIKWIYCKDNPFKVETIGFTGYNDPPQINEFITKYIDYDSIFESEIKNKMTDFYNAMNWGLLPTDINQKALDLFDFSS
jgi:hypothetical protein